MISSEVWSVSDLEEFLQFCCPECDVKEKSKDKFINHVLIFHPEAKIYLANLITEKVTYLVSDNNIQEVPNKNTLDDYEQNDDVTMEDPLESVLIKKEDLDEDDDRIILPKSDIQAAMPDVETIHEGKNICEYCGSGTENMKDHIHTFHTDRKNERNDYPAVENYRNCRNKAESTKVQITPTTSDIYQVHEGQKEFDSHMVNDFHTNEKNDDLIIDPLESVMIKTENFEDEIIPKTDIQTTIIHEDIMNTSEASNNFENDKNKAKEVSNKYKEKKPPKGCLSFCHKVFSDGTCLCRHVQTTGKFYRCEFCSKSFSQLFKVKIHIGTEHKAELSDIANESNNPKSETVQSEVHEGMQIQSIGKFYRCGFCSANFSQLAKIKIHIGTEHKAELPAISNESNNTKTETVQSDVHEGINFRKNETDPVEKYRNFRIKLKSAKVQNDIIYQVHEGQNNKPKHDCEYCGKSFSKFSGGLERHIKAVHNKDWKKLPCQYCGKNLTPENMRVHLCIHDDKRKDQYYICYFCQMKFTESKTLEKHIVDMDHHTASEKSELLRNSQGGIKCMVCHESFSHFKKLNEHVERYHEFRCKCRQKFSSKEKLKKHILSLECANEGIKTRDKSKNIPQTISTIHNGQIHYKCDSCPKLLSNISNLRRHISMAHKENHELKTSIHEGTTSEIVQKQEESTDIESIMIIKDEM